MIEVCAWIFFIGLIWYAAVAIRDIWKDQDRAERKWRERHDY